MSDNGIVMSELITRPNMSNQVLEAQKNDEKISPIVKLIEDGKETELKVKEDGSLYYKDRVCVPNDCELKKAILEDMLRSCVIDYEGS